MAGPQIGGPLTITLGTMSSLTTADTPGGDTIAPATPATITPTSRGADDPQGGKNERMK